MEKIIEFLLFECYRSYKNNNSSKINKISVKIKEVTKIKNSIYAFYISIYIY